jgi:hypothetical protein
MNPVTLPVPLYPASQRFSFSGMAAAVVRCTLWAASSASGRTTLSAVHIPSCVQHATARTKRLVRNAQISAW